MGITYSASIAVSLVAVAIGSYLTELLKKYVVFNPLICNWLIGILIFVLMKAFKFYSFTASDIFTYIALVGGVNAAYKKNFLSIRDGIRRASRTRK